MSTAALQLLAAFEALPIAERDAVIAELLVRHPLGAGELPDSTFVELADEVFQSYEAAEAA